MKQLIIDRCPVCGTKNIEGYEFDVDRNAAYQRCTCANGHVWYDKYQVVEQLIIEDGER